MNRINTMARERLLLPVFLILQQVLFSCRLPDEKIRHELAENHNIHAIVYTKGYSFSIQGSGRAYQEQLRLAPGDYLLKFKQNRTRAMGFAFCRIGEPGLYQLEITGRSYLPARGQYVMKGVCLPHPISNGL